MPHNEVWVKIGADHGGASFKFCIQIHNLYAPNSKEHTVVIGCFEAKDLYPNLVKMSHLFKEGVEALDGMTWKEKILRCFVFWRLCFPCQPVWNIWSSRNPWHAIAFGTAS